MSLQCSYAGEPGLALPILHITLEVKQQLFHQKTASQVMLSLKIIYLAKLYAFFLFIVFFFIY